MFQSHITWKVIKVKIMIDTLGFLVSNMETSEPQGLGLQTRRVRIRVYKEKIILSSVTVPQCFSAGHEATSTFVSNTLMYSYMYKWFLQLPTIPFNTLPMVSCQEAIIKSVKTIKLIAAPPPVKKVNTFFRPSLLFHFSCQDES